MPYQTNKSRVVLFIGIIFSLLSLGTATATVLNQETNFDIRKLAWNFFYDQQEKAAEKRGMTRDQYMNWYENENPAHKSYLDLISKNDGGQTTGGKTTEKSKNQPSAQSQEPTDQELENWDTGAQTAQYLLDKAAEENKKIEEEKKKQEEQKKILEARRKGDESRATGDTPGPDTGERIEEQKKEQETKEAASKAPGAGGNYVPSTGSTFNPYLAPTLEELVGSLNQQAQDYLYTPSADTVAASTTAGGITTPSCNSGDTTCIAASAALNACHSDAECAANETQFFTLLGTITIGSIAAPALAAVAAPVFTLAASAGSATLTSLGTATYIYANSSYSGAVATINAVSNALIVGNVVDCVATGNQSSCSVAAGTTMMNLNPFSELYNYLEGSTLAIASKFLPANTSRTAKIFTELDVPGAIDMSYNPSTGVWEMSSSAVPFSATATSSLTTAENIATSIQNTSISAPLSEASSALSLLLGSLLAKSLPSIPNLPTIPETQLDIPLSPELNAPPTTTTISEDITPSTSTSVNEPGTTLTNNSSLQTFKATIDNMINQFKSPVSEFVIGINNSITQINQTISANRMNKVAGEVQATLTERLNNQVTTAIENYANSFNSKDSTLTNEQILANIKGVAEYSLLQYPLYSEAQDLLKSNPEFANNNQEMLTSADSITKSILNSRQTIIDNLTSPANLTIQRTETLLGNNTTAVGDIHGDFETFVQLLSGQIVGHDGLKITKPLLDSQGNWIGGPNDELIIMGDLFDRAPEGISSISTTKKIMDLQRYAGKLPNGTNKIKVLLGNHDANAIYAIAKNSFYTGMRPGLSLEEFNQLEQNPDLIDWIRNLPAMFVEGDTLYIHSDNINYLKYGRSVDGVNQNIRNILLGNDTGEINQLLGDLTDRGSFDSRNSKNVDLMLNTFGGRNIVHGHSNGQYTLDPRVTNLDWGLSRGYGSGNNRGKFLEKSAKVTTSAKIQILNLKQIDTANSIWQSIESNVSKIGKIILISVLTTSTTALLAISQLPMFNPITQATQIYFVPPIITQTAERLITPAIQAADQQLVQTLIWDEEQAKWSWNAIDNKIYDNQSDPRLKFEDALLVLEEAYGIQIFYSDKIPADRFDIYLAGDLRNALSLLPPEMIKMRFSPNNLPFSFFLADINSGGGASYNDGRIRLYFNTYESHVPYFQNPDITQNANTAVVLHEILHTVENANPDWINLFIAAAETDGLLLSINNDSHTVPDTTAANDFLLFNQYPTNQTEGFALCGTAYILAPLQLKSEQPTVYQFFRDNVFKGVEYTVIGNENIKYISPLTNLK